MTNQISKSFNGLKWGALLALAMLLIGGMPSPAHAVSEAALSRQMELAKKDIECPDKEFGGNLRLGNQYATGQGLAAHQEAFTKGTEEETKSKRQNYYGDVEKKFCIDRLVGDYFSILRKLLSGVSMIEQMLLALVDQLLNMACEYVITAINNALASVCIPLPSLNLDLSIGGGMERKTCDGVSLADVFGVTQASMPSFSSAFGGTTNAIARSIADSLPPFKPMVREVPKNSSTTVKN